MTTPETLASRWLKDAQDALAERDRRRPTEPGYPEPRFSVSAEDLVHVLTAAKAQGVGREEIADLLYATDPTWGSRDEWAEIAAEILSLIRPDEGLSALPLPGGEEGEKEQELSSSQGEPDDQCGGLRSATPAGLDAWDWLAANIRLELSWGEPGDDPSECCWRVHERSGNVNDREWDLIATGDTPLEAVLATRQALSPKGGSQ